MWSEEVQEALREMAQKNYSAAEAAAVLNKTRNSVIGFCYRNKIILRRESQGRPQITLQERVSILTSIDRIKKKPIPRVNYWTPTTCQYIHGEPRGRMFCDRPIDRGSYCEDHAMICYASDK
jgi:hypothetical protein